MGTTNEHLVPDIVKDIVAKLVNGSDQDKFVAEGRLQAIANLVNTALTKYGRK